MASGIAPTPELVQLFADAHGMLQIKIVDEALVQTESVTTAFDSDEAAVAAAQEAMVEETRGGE